MINCYCQICNKCFFSIPSRIKIGKGIFCSKKCYAIAQSKINRGENNPNWKGGVFTLQCFECKKLFTVKRDASKRKYCSIECKRKGKKNVMKIFHCQVCEKPYLSYRKRKYCSKACYPKQKVIKKEFVCKICSKKYQSRKELKACSRKCLVKYSNKKIIKRCSICFAEYETYKSKIKKYCSESCSRKAQSLRQKGDQSHFWKGGKVNFQNHIRSHKLYHSWRKAVFERDNYTCQSCLKTSSDIPNGQLTAHHIIPFSKDLRFSLKKSNGITLCWQCHKDYTKYVRLGILETKENNLQKKAIAFFKKEPNVFLIKIHGDSYQTIGTPDFLGVVSGRATAIELKVYPNFLSPMQAYMLKRLKESGCAVFVCRSLDEVKRVVNIIKESNEI